MNMVTDMPQRWGRYCLLQLHIMVRSSSGHNPQSHREDYGPGLHRSHGPHEVLVTFSHFHTTLKTYQAD